MRKFVAIVVVMVLLTVGVTAVADSASKIGKRITNEYTVKVNGGALSVKAIAVDGTSYAPVRVIASAAGFDVGFRNDEVLLVGKEHRDPMQYLAEFPLEEQIEILQREVEAMESEMERLKRRTEEYQAKMTLIKAILK